MNRAGKEEDKKVSIDLYLLHYALVCCLRVVNERMSTCLVGQADLSRILQTAGLLRDFHDQEEIPWRYDV